MTRLKTALVVTLVAILIWVFAEGESLRSASVGTRVRIDAPAGMALRVVEPAGFTGDVMLDLRGSTYAIDSLRDRLDAGVRLDQTNGIPSAAGDHAVNLSLILREAEPIVDSGVTVDKVDPESLRIRLVALQPVRLPVVAQVEAELEGAPNLAPETVTVHVPAELADNLPQGAAVLARVSAERLHSIPLGAERTIQDVRVELPLALQDQWGVRGPEPPTVDVTVTLRDTTATAVVNRVPVHVRLATSELGRWDIVIDDPWIEDVTIRGPSDLVQRVARSMGPGDDPPAGRVTLLAVLPLGFEELEQGIDSKQVEFVLQPASAGVLQVTAPNPVVRLQITRAADQPDP